MARNYNNNAYGAENASAKKPISPLLAVLILLVIAATVLAVIFAMRFFFKPRISVENGIYLHDKKHDITYQMAPDCYSADLDDKVYATVDGVDYYRLIYSNEKGEHVAFDPLKIIGTVDEFGIITLYNASDFKLPTLEEMNVNMGLIYFVRLTEYLDTPISSSDCALIVSLMKDSPAVERPSSVGKDIDEDSIRSVYLGSTTYPYIRYYLEFYKDTDGNRYLYDSVTDKCINVDKDVLSEVLP